MKTYEILSLDYTEKENKIKIQKALRKIKRFSNISINECVKMELLEEYISRVQRKYNVMINYICPVFVPGEINTYCATIKNISNIKIIKYIYANCIYELYAKICIFYFHMIKTGEAKVVDWKFEHNKIKAKISESE